jgi:hypothetical protein
MLFVRRLAMRKQLDEMNEERNHLMKTFQSAENEMNQKALQLESQLKVANLILYLQIPSAILLSCCGYHKHPTTAS